MSLTLVQDLLNLKLAFMMILNPPILLGLICMMICLCLTQSKRMTSLSLYPLTLHPKLVDLETSLRMSQFLPNHLPVLITLVSQGDENLESAVSQIQASQLRLSVTTKVEHHNFNISEYICLQESRERMVEPTGLDFVIIISLCNISVFHVGL